MKLNFNLFRSVVLSALLLVGVAAEARIISGTVTDQTGETIISASVVVKGTTIGTVTDFDGNYSLEVPDDAQVLVFSYIGLKTQEIDITSDVINTVVVVTILWIFTFDFEVDRYVACYNIAIFIFDVATNRFNFRIFNC